MSKLTEIPPMVERWADACEAAPFGDVDHAARVADALQVYRSITDLIDSVSRDLDGSGAVYDLAAGQAIERVLVRWAAVARAVSAAVDNSAAVRRPVEGASDLRDAIQYTAHALSVTPEQANEQLTRIAREGHQRGVTTEVLRRELLP